MNPIVEKAREYLGTPFHHQGRAPGVGLDCYGLIVCICQELGYEYYDLQGYSTQPDGKTFRLVAETKFKEIPVDEAKEGDMLLMWINKRRQPSHSAIITDRGIIHADSHAGRVVEHGLTDKWKRHIVSAYRIGV